MPRGTIKKLADKGYGFITDGKVDYFFHHSVLSGVKFEELFEGDKVTFETRPGKKEGKLEAHNVRRE